MTQLLDDALLTQLDSVADVSTREGEKLNDQTGWQDTGKLDILAPGEGCRLCDTGQQQ